MVQMCPQSSLQTGLLLLGLSAFQGWTWVLSSGLHDNCINYIKQLQSKICCCYLHTRTANVFCTILYWIIGIKIAHFIYCKSRTGIFRQNTLCDEPRPPAMFVVVVRPPQSERLEYMRTVWLIITNFCTYIQSELLYSQTGYDVTSCFRSAVKYN